MPAKRSKMMKARARRTSSNTMVWAQEVTAKQDSSAHANRTPHTPQKQEIQTFLSSKLEEVTQSSPPPHPPVLLLVTPIDLFTHSADMFGSRPFKSFVQSFDTWYSDKKACRPLYRIHSQHKPPGTIHPPILHIGILDSLRNRSRDQINDLYFHRVPVPFCGSAPQFVVAERVFRRDAREDVIR